MMQKLTLVFIFLLGTSVYSQNIFSISGNIVDSQNQLIFVGDVLLFPLENDTLVKYTSIIEGNLSIEGIPEGSYRLRISCLGFETLEKVLELNKNVSLTIELTESTTDLDEVEVIAAKPIITNENGNLKIDVTNPVFSSIPDPMDLLSRLPNLQVSPDRQSLTIIGKGSPLVYMGNQRISIEELYSLSVDDIGSIEIIRNPSAKYEADGRAVLLITQKKSDTEGIKLNFSETLSFKRNFNNYAGLNGSYEKKKLTLKANFAYNDLLQWESHQFEFVIPEADILSNYLILVDKNDRVELNTGGGLFYQINETDYFSANINRRLQTNEVVIDTDTFLKQGTNEDGIITESNNENTKDFISGNLNFSKKLNTKMNIFGGVQYSNYVQRLSTEIANNYNATEFSISQQRQQRYSINVLAYRFDFDRTFANDFKWELGANISKANANALTNINNLETDVILDVDYDYSENNIAGYSTISGKVSEKINFNVGLRVENNEVKGKDKGDNIPLVDRENTNLFPKASLSIEIDSTKNLTFNYAKSINRPNYSNASSIQVFFNPFLEGKGNVNLLPTFTEELSIIYQFAKNSISMEYFKNKNPIYYTISYETGADKAVFSLKNLEKESGITVNLTVPITKGIWTSTNSVSLSTLNIQDASGTNNDVKPYLYLYTDNQFKIGKETTLSFGGWALTKHSEGIFERSGMVVLNAAITKTFFGKLNCALRINDIGRGMNYEEKYFINGVNADGVYFVDAREIAFSMKYTFGKVKDANFKNKNVDENLNRIR